MTSPVTYKLKITCHKSITKTSLGGRQLARAVFKIRTLDCVVISEWVHIARRDLKAGKQGWCRG